MKRRLPFFMVLCCGAIFVFGIFELFRARFEAGDVYPAYSSLRSDPLGTMAFYESLEQMPGLIVHRDFRGANRLPEEGGAVYLHLAADMERWDWVPRELYEELQAFARRGGRLVVTCYPAGEADEDRFDPYERAGRREAAGSPNTRTNREPEMRAPTERTRRKLQRGGRVASGVSLEREWGLHTAVRPLVRGEDVYEPAEASRRIDAALPRTLNWRSVLVFTNLDSGWRVIYARDADPVLIERSFGRGSVVFATDSYYLSNEALLLDRQPELLAWLIGAGTSITFDEAHMGVREGAGTALLIRQYRLQGLMGGLALLAALYVWRNASSLVPPARAEGRPDYIEGKGAAAGFTNLLRRSIAPRELLDACYAEWKRTAASDARHTTAKLRQAEAAYQSNRHDPLGAYCAICGVLKHGSGAPASATTMNLENSKPETGNEH